MPDQTIPCTYFEQAGPQNTLHTLELAKNRAQELEISHVLVASTSGATGVQALSFFPPQNLVVVTHSAGFAAPNERELLPQHREAIEQAGARILTAQHAFGGIGRAVRRKLGTYQIDEIIAFTLRVFGEGMKVACEIALMAADAGLIPVGEEIIAIGGTSKGADTAIVLLAANAQDFFDLRVLEIICKPRQ